MACPARGSPSTPGLASLSAFQSRLCFPCFHPTQEGLLVSLPCLPWLQYTSCHTQRHPHCVFGEHTEDFKFSTDVMSATPGLGKKLLGITIPFTLCEWRSCRCQGCLSREPHDQSASLAQARPCRKPRVCLCCAHFKMKQTLRWS